MHFMKYAFVLSILLVCSSSRAQETGYLPGAVITKDDGRIEGLVKNVNLVPARILDNIKFKRAEGEKVEIYSPDEIPGYESDGNIFVSKTLPDGVKIFVRKFNSGQLRLYGKLGFDGTASYNVKYIPYVQLENDPVIHIVPQLTFRKQMLKYLKDAPELCKQISDKTLKWGDIALIVDLYNQEVTRTKVIR